MTKRLAAAAFFAGFVLSSAIGWIPKASAADEAVQLAGAIPVQQGGRVKPFAGFAAESVLYITGKSKLKGKDPSLLIWEWISAPEAWSEKPMLPVKHPELQAELADDLKNGRIAPVHVLTNLDLEKKVAAAQIKEKREEALTLVEKKRLELYNRARLFEEISAGGNPGFVPHPEDPMAAWLPFQALTSETGAQVLAALYPPEAVRNAHVAAVQLVERINQSSVAEAPAAMDRFKRALNELLDSGGVTLDQTAIKRELLYMRVRPFFLACALYLVSVFLFLLPGKKENLSRAALVLCLAAFLVHASGFALRVLISGRAPVTNMYESIAWVSWGVVFFAFILWGFYRSSAILAVAASVAALALIVSESAPAFLSPSIAPLVPVLRSNFWLTIHVLTITLGYGAFALNWGMAHAVLYRLAFHSRQKKRTEELINFMYRAMQIGVIFLAAGTVLGGVWASYSWGRFWGWDPKETWALIALLSYLAVLHARSAGWLDNFGVAFWSILAFLTVVMAWYGVNFVLGAGLHSYGFGGGGLIYVAGAVALDLTLLSFFFRRYRMSS